MKNLRRSISALFALCFLATLSSNANGAAQVPKDIVKMKPYVSTAKMGFTTKNEVTMARNAYAKVQALGNMSYVPVGDWLFDPKCNAKSLKPDADTSDMKKVNLPYEWGKDSSGLFRTNFTMPETINGFPNSGSSVYLAFEGTATIDVFINGKRAKSFTGSGELDVTDVIKPGESVTLGVKVTDLTQRGRLGSVRIHASSLDSLKQPVDEILNRLESARLLSDQLPAKQKPLIEAVSAVAKDADALKNEKDLAKVKASLAKMKSQLAIVDKMIADYPTFNQGPYLQNVKPNEITVMWETRVPAASAVYYGKNALDNVVSDPKPVTVHKVILKGLEQQTEYKYLAVTNKLAAPESTFRTSIKRDTPFKFVVWSDNQSNPTVFEPIVDQIIKNKPDIGISVGDVVGHGGTYELWAKEYFFPLRRLIINTPTFNAIGNHEYGGFSCGKPEIWYDAFFSHPGNNDYYFAVTYGNSRFIMLNQQEEIGCSEPSPGSKQYEWLLKELESEEYKKADFHFVFFHKPPYSQCWSGGYYDGEPSARTNLVPLIEKYGIDIVFSGH
ncbi:MAG TPA: metallophosphoesterase family protein, partial [bacterium]|nr:metallophosphoesterase family protein [bacterium]